MYMKVVENHLIDLTSKVDWPEARDYVSRITDRPRPDWELPMLSCRAAGGDVEGAAIGSAALACLQISIILVDDILDHDPRGEHMQIGKGRAANLALAFQAAAFELVQTAPLDSKVTESAVATLAAMGLRIALGQEMSTRQGQSEDDYWRLIRAKSVPFYECALKLGGIMGGSTSAVSGGLGKFGKIIGDLIQIRDDLADAFKVPANPDWNTPRNNILMLYAFSSSAETRNEFESHLPHIDLPNSLEDAQNLLIRCGAVSYAVHNLILRQNRALELLDKIELSKPRILREVVARQSRPIDRLLTITETPQTPGQIAQ